MNQIETRIVRRIPQLLAVGVTAISLLALGLTFEISDASAAGTLPATVNEVVAATASLSAVGCPTSLATTFPSASTFTSLEEAVATATAITGTHLLRDLTRPAQLTRRRSQNLKMVREFSCSHRQM
jgi:hypothetical protein